MVINQSQIRRAVPEVNSTELDGFVAAMNMWSVHFGITTNRRMAHLLAQIFCESNALRAVEENLNYSAEGLRKTFPKYFPTASLAAEYARQPERIANRVYANRMGNGDEASGDGWKYRGRGFIMLTGKSNYQAFSRSEMCHTEVVTYPEKVAQYYLSTMAALWFWQRNRLSDLADLDDGGKIGEDIVKRITRKVNGGTNGLSTRLYYYRRFKKEFCF